MYNSIVVVGHVGGDPEMRYTPNGAAVTNFSVACNRKRGGSDTTTWFRVAAWGKLAETCNTYVSKGMRILVQGEMYMREYTDNNGNRRSSLDLDARDVKFLSSRQEGQGNGGYTGAANYDQGAPGDPRGEDDLPW